MKKEVLLVLLLLVPAAYAQNGTLESTDLQEIDTLIRESEQRMRTFILEQFNALHVSPSGSVQAAPTDNTELKQAIQAVQTNLSMEMQAMRADFAGEVDDRIRDTEENLISTLQQETATVRNVAEPVREVASEVQSATGMLTILLGSVLAINILVLVFVLVLFTRKPPKKEVSPELQNYVTQSRNSGMTDAQIREALQQAGYSDEDIKAALE